MRFTHLLTLASAVGSVTTATASAGAQESPRPAESRLRTVTPRAFRVETDGDPEHRAALGIGTSTSGTLRDTLGLLITSVTRGSPAETAHLEEGNRIAAINGVSLRANAADVEDNEMSNALTRRLTRELGKAKPGDDVELRVYRDGRTQNLKVKTADADSLFRRADFTRPSQADRDNRPALGFGIGSTGSRRDTLGVLVMSVVDSSPASHAGLEEGNRIAAINGVNLQVAREDAGDRSMGGIKATRLQREISQLKPGEKVTMKVFSDGKFRDVILKVARAADLPRNRGGMMFLGGDDMNMGWSSMQPMPPMAPSAPASPMRRMAPMPPMPPMDGATIDIGPEFRRDMEELRTQLRVLRPQLDDIGPRVRMELDNIRPQLERMQPRVQMELENIRPQIERLRMDLPDIMERARMTPGPRRTTVVV